MVRFGSGGGGGDNVTDSNLVWWLLWCCCCGSDGVVVVSQFYDRLKGRGDVLGGAVMVVVHFFSLLL